MKILCPCFDHYIDIVECDNCAEKCDNKPEITEKEMIMDIYNLIFPNQTFVNSKSAYRDIRNELEKKVIS